MLLIQPELLITLSLIGIMHPQDDNALNTEERIWDLTHTINVKVCDDLRGWLSTARSDHTFCLSQGVWWGCKYAIEAMRKNPGGSKGSIINTASFVAIMGAATPQLACLFFAPGHAIELLPMYCFLNRYC